MNEIRHVKIVLKDGRRAVEIPEEFDFPGDEITMRKEGDRIILEPKREDRDFFEWLRSRKPLTENDLLDDDFADRLPEDVETLAI
ncbi:antitoxin VapB [Rhizobium sp. SG_E_25_P2]|uniref:antitoxin n=1 Tax=Rhizobium sp. SG_E_25_P2 TaxID=2879942 RepID=UPI0024744664|nr:AbrB/MazE/SpoVT family DNA-binding domain-containing protein [Rhizobium sp. SG_E_25_P2]MDH6266856.1 antitoxin VapB [Rhizobium sp. SG_E_25_P2]